MLSRKPRVSPERKQNLVLLPTQKSFDYSSIPLGYYDDILRGGNSIRRAWHSQKFERVLQYLSGGSPKSILDVGCFSGSFLSLLPEDRFPRQVGVDILPNQIQYAKDRFGKPYREFLPIKDIHAIESIEGQFDCITLIEVIEHLYAPQIQQMLSAISKKIRPGGQLIISTPNYSSAWPLIEILINRFSDVKYEEQHVTRFNYFNCVKKMESIHPEFAGCFELETKTTSHFIAPFLAGISYGLAQAAARQIDHGSWRFPFGNLIFLSFKRRG